MITIRRLITAGVKLCGCCSRGLWGSGSRLSGVGCRFRYAAATRAATRAGGAVGGGAAGGADEWGERGGEDCVRVAAGGPYHRVGLQPPVHQGGQRRGVPNRGDAADGLPGGL